LKEAQKPAITSEDGVTLEEGGLLEGYTNLDIVCRQDLELAFNKGAIAKSWREAYPGGKIGSLKFVHEARASYTKKERIKNPPSPPPEENNAPRTSPESLYRLYWESQMKREFITEHIKKAENEEEPEVANEKVADLSTIAEEIQVATDADKFDQGTIEEEIQVATDADKFDQGTHEDDFLAMGERIHVQSNTKELEEETIETIPPSGAATKGLSASTWTFSQLVDLCCVPLFEVHFAAIIPGYDQIQTDVMNSINGHYSKGYTFMF